MDDPGDDTRKLEQDVAKVDPEGPQIQDLVKGTPPTVEWGDLPPPDDARWDKVREQIGPEALAKNFVDIAHSPDLERMTRESSKVMAFQMNVFQGIAQLPVRLRAHYRREIVAIAKDLEKDLGLSDLGDMERAQMVTALLIGHDDDDDRDTSSAPTPEGGNERPVPA